MSQMLAASGSYNPLLKHSINNVFRHTTQGRDNAIVSRYQRSLVLFSREYEANCCIDRVRLSSGEEPADLESCCS